MAEILFHRASASFEPNAVLLMYSDGVLERRNNDGEEFGFSPTGRIADPAPTKERADDPGSGLRNDICFWRSGQVAG